MLTIRNIEKLNGITIQRPNGGYIIKEIFEGVSAYIIMIHVVFGKNANKVYEIHLSREKDAPLDRYRLAEVNTTLGCLIRIDEMQTPQQLKYYIKRVIDSSGI